MLPKLVFPFPSEFSRLAFSSITQASLLSNWDCTFLLAHLSSVGVGEGGGNSDPEEDFISNASPAVLSVEES